MFNGKNSLLQKFYSIRPAIETLWDTKRRGSFVNTLPETLQGINNEIIQLLSTKTEERKAVTLKAAIDMSEDAYLCPRDFLVLLYHLDPSALKSKTCSKMIQDLNQLVDQAEEDFLRHVIRDIDPNPSFFSGGAYRLRLSNIISTQTDKKGNIPLSKKNALFQVRAYRKELAAAGVAPFYYKVPRDENETRILEIYASLPDSVKDLFFSSDFVGSLDRSLPLYLARDLILFADNERWKTLKSACDSNDKAKANEEFSRFLLEFLSYERQINNFGLGMTTKTQSTNKLNYREQTNLDWCRPHKWISKIRRKVPKTPDNESSDNG